MTLRAASLFALLLAGCGDGKLETYPVSGKVTVKGQPAAGVFVVFHPADKGKENGPKPFATTGEDGGYRLDLHGSGDGATEGEYAVTLVWNAKSKETKMSVMEGGVGGSVDKLGNRYGDPRNPKFKATVKKGQPNTFDFDAQ